MPTLEALPSEIVREIFVLARLEGETGGIPSLLSKAIHAHLDHADYYKRRYSAEFPELPLTDPKPLNTHQSVDEWQKQQLFFWKEAFNKKMKERQINKRRQRFFDELYKPYCDVYEERLKNPHLLKQQELDKLYDVFENLFIKTSGMPISFLNSCEYRTGKGKTLLHMASEINDVRMVRCLLHQGASSLVFDSFGWTPFWCANQKGRYDIASALKSAFSLNLNGVYGRFQNYAECNILPKWTAGLFRSFRKVTHFPYGKRFDDIVSDAIHALNFDSNHEMTTEKMTEFLGYLKYYAEEKGVDLTAYSDGKVEELLGALYASKIDFKKIDPINPALSSHNALMP